MADSKVQKILVSFPPFLNLKKKKKLLPKKNLNDEIMSNNYFVSHIYDHIPRTFWLSRSRDSDTS